MTRIDLVHVGPGQNCVDCDAPAVGRRRNLDQEPSCLRCEAERLALIQLIVEAAGSPRSRTSTSEPAFDRAGQRTMFGDRRE